MTIYNYLIAGAAGGIAAAPIAFQIMYGIRWIRNHHEASIDDLVLEHDEAVELHKRLTEYLRETANQEAAEHYTGHYL